MTSRHPTVAPPGATDGDDPARLARLLARARTQSGMQAVVLLRHVDPDTVRVTHSEGDGDAGAPLPEVGTELPYRDTVCPQVPDAGPVIVADVGTDPRAQAVPALQESGVRSYIAAPIVLADGSRYGTLCGTSSATRTDLSTADAAVFDFLALLVAEHVEARRAAEAARAATRARIEDVLASGGPEIMLQAAFTLPTLTIRGWEALSRFPAGHGSPKQWFTDATSVGLGVELQLAALRNALATLKLLPARSRIGVNLDPATLVEPELLAILSEVDPESLGLEITDHHEIADLPELTEALEAIHELGIRTTADGTGAGYNGLRHLVELNPTGIKLDRAIVARVDTHPARQAVTAAMVTLAADTQTILLAEGVETVAELRTLHRLGVTAVQGFLLHRPEEPHAELARTTQAAVNALHARDGLLDHDLIRVERRGRAQDGR